MIKTKELQKLLSILIDCHLVAVRKMLLSVKSIY